MTDSRSASRQQVVIDISASLLPLGDGIRQPPRISTRRAPVVIAHQTRALVHVAFVHASTYCGGLTFVARDRNAMPGRDGRTECFARVRVDVALGEAMDIRIALGGDGCRADALVGEHSQPLLVTPSVARLPFDADEQLSTMRLARRTSNQRVATLDVSSWSNRRRLMERYGADIRVTAQEHEQRYLFDNEMERPSVHRIPALFARDAS